MLLEWHLLAASWDYKLVSCILEVDFELLVLFLIWGFLFVFAHVKALSIGCFVSALIVYSDRVLDIMAILYVSSHEVLLVQAGKRPELLRVEGRPELGHILLLDSIELARPHGVFVRFCLT